MIGTICGIINLLKPPGMTSSDAVVDVRRILGVKRVGHTGTLDPAAAGVLPVCIGRATRLTAYLTNKDKEYIVEIVFGEATDTDDALGSIIARKRMAVSRQMLEDTLPSFLGKQMQLPPAYSALWVNGERMYALARSGASFERNAREVEIHAARVLDQTGENRFLLGISCGKGTYVRALCRDIGAKMGSAAYMGFLLRTASGPYTVEQSVTIQELRAHVQGGSLCDVLSAETAVMALPRATVEEWRRGAMCNGLPTQSKFVREKGLPLHSPLRIYCAEAFLGVGHLDEASLVIDALM